MAKRKFTSTILAAAAASLLTTAVYSQETPVKATMIIYLDPSVQFFNPVVKGAQDAAAQFGVDLDVQYANNDPVRQNDTSKLRLLLASMALRLPSPAQMRSTRASATR